MSRQPLFKLLCLGCMVVAIFIVTALCMNGLPINQKSLPLFVNTSTSLPLGFYYMKKVQVLKRGDVIRLCLPEEISKFSVERGYLRHGTCSGGSTRIGKPVLALHGDTVVVTQKMIHVKGHHSFNIPIHTHDQRGKRLPNAIGTHILKEGQCFLLSIHHKLSYDSRYYGPIPCGVSPYSILEKL
ncbi:MAG: conjugative transfer signal peptidase TraF [Bacteroidetes bacterium]|nr:conjugative transfer signal peptidase TraF [Bacteroidota bacterium]